MSLAEKARKMFGRVALESKVDIGVVTVLIGKNEFGRLAVHRDEVLKFGLQPMDQEMNAALMERIEILNGLHKALLKPGGRAGLIAPSSDLSAAAELKVKKANRLGDMYGYPGRSLNNLLHTMLGPDAHRLVRPYIDGYVAGKDLIVIERK